MTFLFHFFSTLQSSISCDDLYLLLPPTLTYAAPAVRTYYTYPGNDKLHFGRLGKGKEAGGDDDDDDATGGLKRPEEEGGRYGPEIETIHEQKRKIQYFD